MIIPFLLSHGSAAVEHVRGFLEDGLSKLHRCVVIGASAGGVEALREVVAQLPKDLSAPVFVVLYIPPFVASSLPQILSRSGPLKAVHPKDGSIIKPGMIYVAPPDHHLLIEGPNIAVRRSPKENRFRPSIDALFRSAAYTYGPRAIGVVLSGVLDDGTSGLWSVERLEVHSKYPRKSVCANGRL